MKKSSPAKYEEEDKTVNHANHVSRYIQPKKEHANPLVYNKGNANFKKDSPKKESQNTVIPTLANHMEHNQQISQKNFLSPINPNDLDMIKKKDSISSVGSDGGFTNTDEFDAREKTIGVSNFIRPPLFEVNNTMQFLLQTKREESTNDKTSFVKNTKENHEANGIAKMPFKSRSMAQQKTEGIEALAADLTPEQYNYLKKMYDFKNNYLFHALNMREVYFQYVSISKSTMNFTNSQDFLLKVSSLLALKKNYAKDFSQIPSNFLIINKFA